MNHVPPPPAQRRQPKPKRKSSAQKAYASESDMKPHHAIPQTPEKTASPAHARKGGQANSRNEINRKTGHHVSTSPEPDYPAQQTTPQRSVSGKGNAQAAAAFAGATFHASPAPSALPMPSFFKTASGTPVPARDAPPLAQQPSPPIMENEAMPSPTLQRPFSAGRPSESSPLDFIFRAHRQENERQRQPLTTNQGATHVGTPPRNSHYAPETFPRTAPQPQTRGYLDPEDPDGTPGQPVGPSFATPYQERLKAYQSNSHDRPPSGQYQKQQQQQQQPERFSRPNEDPTDALKRFLFQGNSGFSNPSANATATRPHPEMTSSRSPAYPQASQQAPSRNVEAMENDLRRILKLDLQ